MTAVLIIIVVVAVVLVIAGGTLVTTRSRRLSRLDQPARSSGVAVKDRTDAYPTVQPTDAASDPGTFGSVATVEAPAERPVLRDRLGKARQLLGGYLGGIRGRAVDDSTFDELEEALLLADAGITTTTRVLEDLRARVKSGDIDKTPEALLSALRGDLEDLFDGDSPELHFGPDEGPTVWLLVGVNGVGKTTTIGKLAKREVSEGKKVVLAAGDTFRAAAGEQLETWAERAGAGLIRGSEGADPSSVIFDAVQHAAARSADLVIADTAGRLHTKVNLMEELRKVRRIAEREPGQLTEVLLVLDATTGQNGLTQAKQFTDAVNLTGVVLTKLDGTAKGGVVLAVRSELGLPIKLVGLGEKVEDLVEFDPKEFVSALFE
ncbi:MAG TPA: signal recognition particle-docking protein FtsY [Acidimicrobiales bacterium]|jgi:fused signal recognition particle receptor|nr:signal recognition particle-docking protein FtsY [Acidimicrobiales bacterium]